MSRQAGRPAYFQELGHTVVEAGGSEYAGAEAGDPGRQGASVQARGVSGQQEALSVP